MASISSFSSGRSTDGLEKWQSNAALLTLDQLPPSPTKSRTKRHSLCLQSIGVDPQLLVGKSLTHVRRSPTHPNLTMVFSDGTTYKILVDGYDPVHRGVPKTLEMDPLLSSLVESVAVTGSGNGPSTSQQPQALNLRILDCTFIRMTDKAFERKEDPEEDDQRWDQTHLALAFKFGDLEEQRWHCVWAMLEVFDETVGSCTFRSYNDVYLQRHDRVQYSPRSPRKRRTGQAREW